MIKIAALQMTSHANVIQNLDAVAFWADCAAKKDVKLLVLPENFAYMSMNESDRFRAAENFGHGQIQDFLAQISTQYNLWIIAGTIPIKTSAIDKIHAACLVYNAQGQVVGRYDKIHLFDAEVADNKKNYRESVSTQAGHQPVVVETPFGKIGIAICYDLRFPELFRIMSHQGAQLFAVPAAFTKPTGQAHWKTLLQARAIENLCYVLASGQCGKHENGRETYGHSMIVNPWGEILAEEKNNIGLVIAEIDLEAQKQLRETFPVLTHRRL
jgi:nitrilase